MTAQEDSRLKELRGMTPKAVHDKLIQDAGYRSKSSELKQLAKNKLDKNDVDMFERLLFLGIEGDDLDEALQKVNGKIRSHTPAGWLGTQIDALQERMNKAPKVASGWGMLGGMMITVLCAALAWWLFKTPAVKEFMVEATSVVLAIGMIISFLLGLTGGFGGGVVAALAWSLITYLLNMLVPIETLLHILACILALVPAVFGIRWMWGSTPAARRKDRNARERHISKCQEDGKELVEYIEDVLLCIAPKATTGAGSDAQRYYQAAAEKIRRMRPM